MAAAPVIRRLKPLLGSMLRIAVTVYLALAGLLFFFQSRFVYYPERACVDTPDGIGTWRRTSTRSCPYGSWRSTTTRPSDPYARSVARCWSCTAERIS